MSSNKNAAPLVGGRTLRIFRHITDQRQAHFARLLGIQPALLCRFETGKQKITRQVAEKIGCALFLEDEDGGGDK